MNEKERIEVLRKNKEYIQYCVGELQIIYQSLDAMNLFTLRLYLKRIKEVHEKLSDYACRAGGRI